MLKKCWLLLLLLLVVSLAVTVVSAQSSLPETCPQCNQAVTWTGLSTVAEDAASLEDGHYYMDYTEEIHCWETQKKISGNVCIYMNGKTLTATSRVFEVTSGTLSICGEGVVRAGDFPESDIAYRYGGVAYVQKGGKLVLRDATLTDIPNETTRMNGSNGGILFVHGTFDMHSGVVCDGTSSNAGGNIFVSPSGTFRMYGGTIRGGKCISGLKSSGASVVNQGRAVLSGDASINLLYMHIKSDSPALKDMLTVEGKYTGSVRLKYSSADFAMGLVLGTSAGANLRQADIRIDSCSYYLVAEGADLKLSDWSANVNYCQGCQKEISDWVALTEAQATASTLEDGHYYLDFDAASTVWVSKNISGKVCLELNGVNLQCDGRFADIEGTLNVQGDGTVTGGGAVSGSTTQERAGGVFNVRTSGTLNLYGGTYQFRKYSADRMTPYNGGIVYAIGNANIYAGTLLGVDVGGVGGGIFIGPSGSLMLAGGSLTGGDDIAICTQGKITLTGSPVTGKIQLRYKSPGPALGEQLIIQDTYSGAVTLQFYSATAAELKNGCVIGISQNADLRHAAITLQDSGKKIVNLYVIPQGNTLVLSETGMSVTTKDAYCEVCDKTVTWTALMEDFAGQTELDTGHYYLDFAEGSCLWNQKTVVGQVCLDLNGMSLTGATRAFRIEAGSIMNIIGPGTVIGRGCSESYDLEDRVGGTILIEGGSVLNLYSGKLTFQETTGQNAGNGGILNIAGTFNMYGGEIADGQSSWVGGNVFVTIDGTVKLYGGTISGGSAKQAGNSVACRGKVMLTGDANANEIYLYPNTEDGGPALSEMLTIRGKYSGAVKLRISKAALGMDIGTGVAPDLSDATITTNSSTASAVTVLGSDLVLTGGTSNVMIFSGSTPLGSYNGLDDAMNAYEGFTQRIVLFADVQDVTLTKNVIVDLNGCDIKGAVAGNYALYCMDSHTDDYDVSDGVYGTAPNCKQVSGVPQQISHNRDSYRMIPGENNTLSFHRVHAQVVSISLRPKDAGLYFTCAFRTDHMIQPLIKQFGVALSVEGDEGYTYFTVCDKESMTEDTLSTSVLVRGIIKDGMGSEENTDRSQMQICCSAYVEFEDATMYSPSYSRSLREQVEGVYREGKLTQVGVDTMLESLTPTQQLALYGMYLTYQPVMGSWSIPNIAGNAPEDQAALDKAIDDQKILQSRRNQVVSKMRTMGELLWVADEDIYYVLSTGRTIDIRKGRLYRGMLYSFARTDEQSFLEYAGEPDENGFYHISGLTDASLNEWGYDARIGTDCGGSVVISYKSIGASVKPTAGPTTMVPSSGFLPVGSYVHQETADGKTGATKDVTVQNGTEVMYASYAKIQPADILSTSTGSGGHSIMAVGKYVVYNQDGTIDGARSYIRTLEQTPGPISASAHSYDPILDRIVYTCFVEKNLTFDSLFDSGYLPVNCLELIDADAIPETAVVTDSLDASSYSYENLFEGILYTNRMISNVTMTITNDQGESRWRMGFGIRTSTDKTRYIDNYYMQNFLTEDPAVLRGNLDPDALTAGDYRCTVEVLLSSGERFTVRDFQFTISQ